ncbi:MAG: 16S rRNA processing protein RimM [Myxococcaceae bacterium]|nr:16S rRNA processing protein RimM [Myxococcaceae bacterium]
MSPPPNSSSSDWLQVGYIARAHGLRGELGVRTFDSASTALGEVDRVQLTTKTGVVSLFALETLRDGPKGDLLMTLAGVRSREAADALVGSTVAVHRAELEPPDDGEVFQGDLIGLEAKTPDGRRLGVVSEVWSSGPVPNLVVKDGDAEQMIPFADDFVVKIDLEARTILLRPLEFEEA